MTEALIGLAGIVVGAVLGATGTYWRLRRDAWAEARANGLMLLAAVRAVLAEDERRNLDDLLAAWDQRAEVLAKFRRGSYPSGLEAPEWLKLATRFASLRRLSAATPRDDSQVRAELVGATECLAGFEYDPPVFPYVVVTGLKNGWPGLAGAAAVAGIVILALTIGWLAASIAAALVLMIAARPFLKWWRGAARAG